MLYSSRLAVFVSCINNSSNNNVKLCTASREPPSAYPPTTWTGVAHIEYLTRETTIDIHFSCTERPGFRLRYKADEPWLGNFFYNILTIYLFKKKQLLNATVTIQQSSRMIGSLHVNYYVDLTSTYKGTRAGTFDAWCFSSIHLYSHFIISDLLCVMCVCVCILYKELCYTNDNMQPIIVKILVGNQLSPALWFRILKN